MSDPYEKISPATSAWLQSIENDGTVERALLNVLIEAESAPDLFKALGLARDFFYSPDLRLLGRAAMLLGTFDNPAAQALLEVLLNHSDPRLRVVAMEASHVSGSTWALRKALGRLADRDERVAKRAMELYRSWSSEQVRTMFLSLLDAGDTTSLIDAAEGLSRVAEPPLLDLVEKTFARVDISLKRKLLKGITRLASREVNGWVKELIAKTNDELGKGVLETALKEMNALAGIVEAPPPPPPPPPVVVAPPPPPPPVVVAPPPMPAATPLAPVPSRVPAFARTDAPLGANPVTPSAPGAVRAPTPVAPPPAPTVPPPTNIPPPLDPMLSNPFESRPIAPNSRITIPDLIPADPSPPPAQAAPSAAAPFAAISMPSMPLPAASPAKPAAPIAAALPAPGMRILPTPAELMSNPGRDLEMPSLSDSGTFTIHEDMFDDEDDTIDPDETQDNASFSVEEVNIESLTNAPTRLTITPGPVDSGSFIRPQRPLNPGSAPGLQNPGSRPGNPGSVPGVPASQALNSLSVPQGQSAGSAHAGVNLDASMRRKRPVSKAPVIKTSPADTERLHALLRQLVTKGGSDLHIKGGVAPYFRLNGRIGKINQPAVSPDQLLASIVAITTPVQFEQYWQKGDLDLSIGLAGAGRFRLNINKSRGVPGLVARLIPSEIPSVDDLHLPSLVCKMTDDAQGLILVTGPTGSGKSTTLAAILDYINSSRHGHIITVEDPLEFLHRDKLCTITQRELGTDALTFAEGLAFANRMDPDVVMVGELRDLDTIRAAFQSAGSGRLVLATAHTNSASKTIERVISVFPAEEQPQARVTLSLSLTAVVSQTLVPASAGGRVPAHEILIATGGIRKAIRENNSQGIYTQIESGANYGMVTLEQSLVRLHRAGKITRRDALRWAADPALVENLL